MPSEIRTGPASALYPRLLRTLLPAAIPVAMFLIAVSTTSLREVNSQTVASTAKSLTEALAHWLLSSETSNPQPDAERVRLNVSRTGRSDANFTAPESERQFAKLLARRMDSLNFSVTISVAESEQLSLAESLAAAMIEECPATSDRIALRLDPVVTSNTVEVNLMRTPGSERSGRIVR